MERFVMSMLAALVAFVCSAPQGGLHSLLAPAGWGIAEAIAQTAVANTITITNKSGAVITNYPFQFGRPFIAGSIPNQPQVLINGTAVVTQADVKNRYPDGSIKFAVIAVMIPTIPTTGSLTLTFRNQTLGNNTPLTQAQMLDPLYAFNAYIILSTPGAPGLAPQFVSAKQMLQNGDYQLWTSGPVAQTIILADDSTSRKYDLGFDGYRPFRPRFYATFWPATHQVALRYVGENGNSQELEDLSYDLTLVTGNIKGYTKTGLTHWVLTNWTKYFWLGGAPPAQVNIDPNIAYLASTRFIPNYDPAVSVPETEMAAYYSQWSSYPHDPYDAYYNHPLGNVVWTNDMSAAGGRNEIGPYPIWSLLWLYTGDWRMRQFALGMADLATAFPANLRETNTGKRLLRTDAAGSSTGLGHTIVTTDHKSLVFGAYYFLNPTGVVASDRVTVVGPISLSPPFSFDTAHEPSPFYLQYLVTGCARRAAGIGAGGKTLAAPAFGIVADGQIARNQIDLLPIVVDEGCGREHPRRKPQEPGAAAIAALLVERAGQDLLFDAGGVAGWRLPARTHVEAVEFEMRLVDRHAFVPPHYLTGSNASAAVISSLTPARRALGCCAPDFANPNIASIVRRMLTWVMPSAAAWFIFTWAPAKIVAIRFCWSMRR